MGALTARTHLLEADYLSIYEARSRCEFKAALVRSARKLEFSIVSTTVFFDHLHGPHESIGVSNTPTDYREAFESTSNGRIDPVMQHCKTSGLPIVWDRSTYVHAGRVAKWEHQAQFGYHCGIALASHLPRGRHLLIGVNRDQPLPRNSTGITRMTASLQLFIAHAEEAAARVLLPKRPDESNAVALTPRELECLRWTMEGKTAWELGQILSIAENTVVRHPYSATRKFDAVNKHQAVLKALRLGIIE